MAINTTTNSIVSFQDTFNTVGITYDITGAQALAITTPDGSTAFNVAIPADNTYEVGTLAFKDSTNTTITTLTPSVAGQTLSFSIAQSTSWTTGLCTIQFYTIQTLV